MLQRLPLALTATLVAGCATIPGPQTAAQRLQQAQLDESQQCSATPTIDWRMLSPPNVERVDPVYFSVQHGRGNVERELRGVQVRVRPQPGMTAPGLAAMLSCHRAHRLLGHPDGAAATDAFALADAWVDIRVEAADAVYVVTVRADEPRDNQTLLDGAQSLVRVTSAAH
jgi:hypothetical protein